jgi:EAL domain-containing protein (putative c-di-GMP-specific phosphodiesterase class I)
VKAVKTTLGLLRASGVKIAIDDLGMEFSNLKRVQQLEVDSIKLDKSFLRDADGAVRG